MCLKFDILKFQRHGPEIRIYPDFGYFEIPIIATASLDLFKQKLQHYYKFFLQSAIE